VRLTILTFVFALAARPVPLTAQSRVPADGLATAILKELVEIPTTDSAGTTRQAAQAMAKRLLDAGFPSADVQVIEGPPGTFALVARYRAKAGSTRKPILMLAHLDVVPARREDWSFDPFGLRERDGFYYGRGVMDNKAGDATLVANFIRWKREGWTPSRDLIMALTGDEETASASIRELLGRHRDLVDAEYALNTDAGGGELRNGRPVTFSVQTAEKVYQTYHLETRSPGGHSSVPTPGNAIYRLSAGLMRLSRFGFPLGLNETTRTYLERSAAGERPELARDMRAAATGDTAAARRLSAAEPYYNALLHTTCVATLLSAGHANNALPQRANANINCRIFPGTTPEQVRTKLAELVGDPEVKVIVNDHRSEVPKGPQPLNPKVFGPVETLTAKYWPGVPVVPTMSAGATDGAFLSPVGIPTYGVSGIFFDTDGNGAHGLNERVRVDSVYKGRDFLYDIVKVYANQM